MDGPQLPDDVSGSHHEDGASKEGEDKEDLPRVDFEPELLSFNLLLRPYLVLEDVGGSARLERSLHGVEAVV